MNVMMIKDQINEYFDDLPLHFKKNKFFTYLTSSIFKLSSARTSYINLLNPSINIRKDKFIIDDESITDTTSILEQLHTYSTFQIKH